MKTVFAGIALLSLAAGAWAGPAAPVVDPHELDGCLATQQVTDQARQMAVIADAKGWFDLSPEAATAELVKLVPPAKRAQLADEAVRNYRKAHAQSTLSDEKLHAIAEKSVQRKLYQEMKTKVDTLIPNAATLKDCGVPTDQLRLFRPPKSKS